MSPNLIHPDLGNGLTNHQPMVASALRELGATKSHVARYNEMMSAKTKVVKNEGISIFSDEELAAYIGKQSNFAGIHRYLTEQQVTLGSRVMVNRYVPMLAEGISGAAFHAVIRLGHAVHDFNDEEIVSALAYWVWAFQQLPYPQNDVERDVPIADVIQHLVDDIPWVESRIDRPTITEEFEVVTEDFRYQQMRFKVTKNQITLDKLQRLAIAAFWMHDDFTLLHGVTGVQAVSRISLWLDDASVLLAPMWKGLVVAWLSKGLRWKDAPLPVKKPTLSLAEIKNLAAQGTRDHTVKLVAACLDQYPSTQNELYWYAAEREIMNDAQLKSLVG
jgi:hypothetical protein